MLQAVSSGTLDCAQTAATNFSDDSLGILQHAARGHDV